VQSLRAAMSKPDDAIILHLMRNHLHCFLSWLGNCTEVVHVMRAYIVGYKSYHKSK